MNYNSKSYKYKKILFSSNIRIFFNFLFLCFLKFNFNEMKVE